MPVLKVKNNDSWQPVYGIPNHTHTVNDITDLEDSAISSAYIINVTQNGDGEYVTDNYFNWDDMIAAYNSGAQVMCKHQQYMDGTLCRDELYYLIELEVDDNRAYFNHTSEGCSIDIQIVNVNNMEPRVVSVNSQSFVLDTTLSESGKPADAKVVGEKFDEIRQVLDRYDQDIQEAEYVGNRVTTIDSTSDDNHYPSAKAVYDYVGNIEAVLDGIIASQENLIGGDTA